MTISQIKSTRLRRTILIVGAPLFAIVVVVGGAAIGIVTAAKDTISDWRGAW